MDELKYEYHSAGTCIFNYGLLFLINTLKFSNLLKIRIFYIFRILMTSLNIFY